MVGKAVVGVEAAGAETVKQALLICCEDQLLCGVDHAHSRSQASLSYVISMHMGELPWASP